jgi:hypothetical protein
MGKYGLLLVLLLFGSIINAKTVYVSTSGIDNSANCSSIQRTMDGGIACLAGGDTLLVKPGTYTPPTLAVPDGLGSWATATKIRAESNLTVTLKGGGGGCFLYPCNGVGQSWVIVEGFIWDGVNANAQGGTHIRYINNEMKNSKEQSVQYGGSYHEFINNKVHDGGDESSVAGGGYCYTPGCGTPQEHGIYLTGDHHLVEGNEFYNIWGCGVHFWSDKITHNYNIVRNNYIHDNGRGLGCAGIVLYGGSNNQVYGNIVVRHGGGDGIAFTSGNNNLIYNNTVYANGRYGISFTDFSGAVSTAYVKNNIVWQNANTAIVTFGSGIIVDKNWLADPNFVNSSNDFHLQSGSLAIDKGTTIISPSLTLTSYSGSAPDPGAFEFGGSAPSSTPRPPQNLKAQ